MTIFWNTTCSGYRSGEVRPGGRFFLEYEGALYLRRGSRGYGAVTIDLDILKFVEQKNDRYYVTVDYLLFEEYDETMLLEFENRDGHWILSDKEKYI